MDALLWGRRWNRLMAEVAMSEDTPAAAAHLALLMLDDAFVAIADIGMLAVSLSTVLAILLDVLFAEDDSVMWTRHNFQILKFLI